MAEDLKKLESLSYRPAKSSPATLGMNSAVIKPAKRVNKAEDAEQPKCGVCGNPLRKDRKGCLIQYCGEPCPPVKINEQLSLKIIGEIEGLMSQVNKKMEKLLEIGYWRLPSRRPGLISRALEDIDKFQKTTLYELRKELE